MVDRGSWWCIVLALTACMGSWAYDNNRNDNLAVYWGQDSSGNQQKLSYYCQDDVYNVIPLAFLYIFFGEGGEPQMSFANICNEQNGTFPDTNLSNCTFMESDIEYCQSKGKLITLSLGGADSVVGFINASQAEDFADTVWNSFLGGSSDVRPFGKAVLDGVDLDIEGGLPTYYNNFIDRLQTYTDQASKRYYYTAAPQCPFPDAYSGPAINESKFDAVYVQFYNNYCGLNYPQQFDFSLWDTWARTQSPNPDVKIYIGAPGSAAAAQQGYVSPATLKEYALAAQSNYSTFGGVMLWDASDAYENNRYDKSIKETLTQSGADVTDGGSLPTGSGGGGSGTDPNSNSTGQDGGSDGGLNTGKAECVQRPFSLASRDLAFTENDLKSVYNEKWKTVGILSTIARRHTSQITSVLSKVPVSGRKYNLYHHIEL